MNNKALEEEVPNTPRDKYENKEEFEKADLHTVLYEEDEDIVCLMSQLEMESEPSFNHYPDTDEEDAYRELEYAEEPNIDEVYDWELLLGSGYWDSNGGSPQWVPTDDNCLPTMDYNADYELSMYFSCNSSTSNSL